MCFPDNKRGTSLGRQRSQAILGSCPKNKRILTFTVLRAKFQSVWQLTVTQRNAGAVPVEGRGRPGATIFKHKFVVYNETILGPGS